VGLIFDIVKGLIQLVIDSLVFLSIFFFASKHPSSFKSAPSPSPQDLSGYLAFVFLLAKDDSKSGSYTLRDISLPELRFLLPHEATCGFWLVT